MRNIKFRAWDGQKIVHVDSMNYEASASSMVANGWLLPGTIMQFTGLKDKNDKEIYEADIIEYMNPDTKKIKIHFVAWSQKKTMYILRFGPTDEETARLSNILNAIDRFSIVGNIYENPELLTKI